MSSWVLSKFVVVLTGLVLGLSASIPVDLSVPAVWTAAEPQWQIPTSTPPMVNRAFTPPAQPWLRGHRGVDLGAGTGQVIHAAASGTVIYAGVLVDRPVISIRHQNGLRSTYEPVEALVTVGQAVTKGQPIGNLVSGHDANSLHWGAKYSDRHYIDPIAMVVGPFTLKPW